MRQTHIQAQIELNPFRIAETCSKTCQP